MLTSSFLKPSTAAGRETRYRSQLFNHRAAARGVASTPAEAESIPPEDSAMSGRKRSPRSKSAKIPTKWTRHRRPMVRKGDDVVTCESGSGDQRPPLASW